MATRSRFGAGRRPRESSDSSNVRIHAQSRAELESSRARVPYIAGCEFSPATVLRTGAQPKYPTRCRPAYGHCPSRAGPSRPDFRQKISGTCADSPREPRSTSPAPFVAGTVSGDFHNRSHLRTSAKQRLEIECLPRGHYVCRDVQLASYHRPAQACASVEAETLPRRLRPPSVNSRSTASVPSTTKSPACEVHMCLMPGRRLEPVLEPTRLARTDCLHVVLNSGTHATVSAENPSDRTRHSPMPAPASIIMPTWPIGSVPLRSPTSLAARSAIHYHSTRISHRVSRSVLHRTTNDTRPG